MSIRQEPFSYAFKLVMVSLIYFFTARFGLRLAAIEGVATSVWPPTGISLAALIIFGYELWPGIFLGACFANFSVGQLWSVSLGIGIGNTVEALLASYLLKAWLKFDGFLARLRDVLGLIFAAAFLSTAVCATIGVSSAWLGGRISAGAFGTAWWTWWLGDMMGDLVFASFLLTWGARQALRMSWQKFVEFIALILCLAFVSQVAFGNWNVARASHYPFVFLIIPFMIWAALRFGPRGATTSILLVTALAIASTARGWGPFIQKTLNESLFTLQFFIGVVSGTILVLAATFMERKIALSESKQANLELQRLSQLKSEFASIVAHELKTPLTIIKEGVGMVLEGVDGPVNLEQQETLSMAQDNIDRLGRLINNVLNYEKLEAGKMELHYEWADLNEVTVKVFQFMELMGKQKKVRMHLEVPPDPVRAQCDSDKIKEVLINLLDNAFKHTPKGGDIWLRLMANEERAVWQVEDTGPGIRFEDREKIFQMFRRANSKSKIPGSGVGLAICKLLVELHQGAIFLESEPGKGSKFTIYMPKAHL